jgi:hypothetical protein
MEQPLLQAAYDRAALDVRAQAVEILFAVGSVKLARIAMFRAGKWARISTDDEDDRCRADLAWIRAAEWWRIGWALASN